MFRSVYSQPWTRFQSPLAPTGVFNHCRERENALLRIVLAAALTVGTSGMVSPALAQGYLSQQYDPKMRRDQPQSSDDQMRRDEQARRDKGMRPDDRARRNDHGNRDQQSNRNGGMRRDERGNYNNRGHDDRDHQRHCGTVWYHHRKVRRCY